jgi:acyltransferase
MKQVEYLNIAKGIGILLVVLGHQPINSEFFRFIYSFHMAFFFILFGFLFKAHHNIKPYLTAKAQVLVGTYIIASIWSVVFFALVSVIKEGGVSLNEILMKGLDYLLGSAHSGNLTPNGPIWFLLAYFFYNVYFQLIYFVSQKIGKLAHIVFIPPLLILLNNTSFLPFSFNATILAIPFFYIGVIYKKLLLRHPLDSSVMVLITCVFLVVFYFLFNIGNSYDISVSQVGYYWDFILLGGFFFLPILLFASFLKNTLFGSLLKFIGERTIGVLCYHIIFITGVSFTISKVLGIEYENLRESMIYMILVVAVYPFILVFILNHKYLEKFFKKI